MFPQNLSFFKSSSNNGHKDPEIPQPRRSQGSFTSLSWFLIVNSLFIVPVYDTRFDFQVTSLLVGCLLVHMKASILTEEKTFL